MKRILLFILAFITVVTSFAGCTRSPKKDVDLSAFSFVGKTWVRTTESCTETIYFNDDGDCGYYCSCGNPVNDDDLCEGYTFDPDTMTVYYDFIEKTKETVTKVTVISYDDENLVLDFNGDERTFELEKEEEEYIDTLTYDGKTYRALQYNADIFCYDLAYSVEYEEDETVPLESDRWELVYRDGDVFVLDSQHEEASDYYGDDKNYSWSVFIYPEDRDEYSFPVTLSEADLSYVYSMEDMERDTTLAFDDIEEFATLVKTSADGLISATVSLAYSEGVWYWRSEMIDDSTDGWPEYVFPLPDGLNAQIESSIK